MDFLGIFALDLIHFFVPLLVDLLHGFLVLLLQPLDFLYYVLLPLLLVLYLLLVVLLQLPQLLVVLALVPNYLFLEKLRLLFLGPLQLIVFRTLLHHIFGLVGIVLLQSVLEFLLFGSDLFVEFFLHQVFLLLYGAVSLGELCLV